MGTLVDGRAPRLVARPTLIAALTVVTTLAFAGAAAAQPGPDRVQPPGLTDAVPPPPADTGRDTHRWMLGAGFGVFANYPMSIEDPGATLIASKPLWLGNRYQFFQWASDIHGTLGFGSEKLHAYAIVGPNIGCNLYFGSVFGLEFRFGLDATAQLGKRTVGGLMFGMDTGFVFRLWKDDRKRLKLLAEQRMGGYFADDPGNDMGMNAMAFVLGLGYEQPM